MTVKVEQVPTQGFNAPPPQPAQAPVVAQPNPVPNGNPIRMEGDQPGYQQPQPTQAPAPEVKPELPGGLAEALAKLNATLDKQTQPQPTPAPEETPSWLQDVNNFDLSTVKDPIIKSMATALQVAGKDLDLNRVLGRALHAGDPSLIDVHYIAEKGGANAAQLVELAKGIVQAVEAKSASITKEVHSLVGGEAQWNQSVAVFNQAAPKELRLTVARMLDSADEEVIRAGAKMVAEFSKASGHLPQGGAPLLGTAPVTAAGQGLSKDQFKAELNKLDPNSPDFIAQQEALFARRAIGKRLGL